MKSELQVFYDDKHFINSNCPELISADFASCKSTMVYSYNDSTCTTQKQNRFCKDLLDGKISVWSYINVSPKLSFGGFMSYVIHFWHPSLTALFKPPSNWLMYPHHGHRTCNHEHIRSLILKASLHRPKIEMSGWVDFAQHVLNVCEGVYHNMIIWLHPFVSFIMTLVHFSILDTGRIELQVSTWCCDRIMSSATRHILWLHRGLRCRVS